jgi:hypothetical protein
MATRTIQSPGVEIRERDLSLTLPQNVGTNVFVAGFANQGPTDEVLKVSSRDELEQIYGTPTNSSERYFYYTLRELLNSPANIYTFRLPYGEASGDGFGSQYSALVYPVVAHDGAALTTNLSLTAATYFLGAPTHIVLTESDYQKMVEGSLFDWGTTATAASALTGSLSAVLSGAGIIVLNKSQTTINSQFEGYYVGLADNTNINPATNFDAVVTMSTLSLSANRTQNYTTVPNGTLQFELSSTTNGATNSISRVLENLTEYDIDDREDDDLLNIGVFKVRKSIYATESFKLDYVLDDAIVGSIDSFRTQLNPNGGASLPFFLESVDNNSRNVEIFVNPYISNKFTQSSLNLSGVPTKKIRIYTSSLVNNFSAVSAAAGAPLSAINELSAYFSKADSIYPLGAFSNPVVTQKIIGNVPTKVNRALESVKNDEVYDIDVVVEAGLGTIFTMACAAQTAYYDDTLYNAAVKNAVDSLRTTSDINSVSAATGVRGNYSAVFNQFENFCNLPSNTGGRGDCIFVADVLRHILVTGRSNKILSDKTKNFQQHVYWAMRHQLELENTSYATVYGNWVQIYEEFSGEKIWAPFSGYAAATMARTDANFFPWIAPAGFNRGLLTTSALDIAITPNQKQRDELYKSNINPVTFNANDGFVIMGQKTLSRKPSSFDRINVRRLFLALERPTKKVSKYFVFEPNTEFTRTRFINTLTPLFENAKNNEGIYDYILVCDERNNTPEVIDANELKLDAFVKATRAAEYILVTFTSTRTDADFQELI